MRVDGYKASQINLNSPEINKLAYSPQMNDHVNRIKKHHKEKSDFNGRENMQLGKEIADQFRSKAVGKVVSTGLGLPPITNIMSNADRRRLGSEQCPELPDYQPMVDQGKANRQTKGARHGIKKHFKRSRPA